VSEETKIAWTDRTFNAWIGCAKWSSGCTNCYAERLARERLMLDVWGPDARRQVTAASNWAKPRRWNREAQASGRTIKIFCGSLMDWCEDNEQLIEPRARLWRLIRETPCLTWQLLTKRAERIAQCLPADWGKGWPHVWLGATIEGNRYVKRANDLRKIPVAVRFVSYEPAIAPLDKINLKGIDWLIFGGESGPGYRPCDMQWARDIRARCEAAGVAFFFKQSAAPRTDMGIELDG